MLHEQIKEKLKEAMMARDSVRLEVMRGFITAFTNELVATGKTPQDIYQMNRLSQLLHVLLNNVRIL